MKVKVCTKYVCRMCVESTNERAASGARGMRLSCVESVGREYSLVMLLSLQAEDS